jgi:hypothetical protein
MNNDMLIAIVALVLGMFIIECMYNVYHLIHLHDKDEEDEPMD